MESLTQVTLVIKTPDFFFEKNQQLINSSLIGLVKCLSRTKFVLDVGFLKSCFHQ